MQLATPSQRFTEKLPSKSPKRKKKERDGEEEDERDEAALFEGLRRGIFAQFVLCQVAGIGGEEKLENGMREARL